MYYLVNLIKFKNHWKILENGKKYWKSQGKVREFCQSGKVGTLILFIPDNQNNTWFAEKQSQSVGGAVY